MGSHFHAFQNLLIRMPMRKTTKAPSISAVTRLSMSCAMATPFPRPQDASFPSLISPRSDGARLGQLADLRQQAHDVHDLPLLLDLAVATTADREAGELDVVAGDVPAADCDPGRDVVALGELVVDRDAEIGDLRAVALDHLGQAVGAAD